MQVRDGYEYERFAALELGRRGFRRIKPTPASRDYGVDLLGEYNGERWAIQCKYYTHPVDGSAVQEAVAGMAYYDCQRAMVITNASFTPAARELAQANGVELLESVEPKRDFFSRRRPWELVLLSAQCVVFYLVLREMLAQHSLTPNGLGVLVLLCFPGTYLAVRLLILLVRLLGRRKGGQDKDRDKG